MTKRLTDIQTDRHISTMINQHIRKRIGCLFFYRSSKHTSDKSIQCINTASMHFKHIFITNCSQTRTTNHCRKITYKLSNPTHKTCTYAADWHMAYEYHGNNTNSTQKIYIMSLNNREKTQTKRHNTTAHTRVTKTPSVSHIIKCTRK